MAVVREIEDVFWFGVAALASWRITAMLCYEQGPFDLFARLRALVIRVGLVRLVSCFHCANVWVSAAVAAPLFGLRRHAVPYTILLVLAVAGVGSIIERALGGDTNDST